VVTDGLVHTSNCSVYAVAKRAGVQQRKKASPQNALSADAGCQAEMREFPGNFRNTDVELMIIRRTKALGGDLQTHELVEWLERYFLNGGARQVLPMEPQFTGFVFKIQANMDPRHRDRIWVPRRRTRSPPTS
jgi:hypothetical protein